MASKSLDPRTIALRVAAPDAHQKKALLLLTVVLFLIYACIVIIRCIILNS